MLVAAAVALIAGVGFFAMSLWSSRTAAPAATADVSDEAQDDDRPAGRPLGDPPQVAADPVDAWAESTALLSTEEIVTRSMPAVVTIMTPDGLGSGFFVASDTVITNAHVVAGHAVVAPRRGF
jgi:S1-C subfamily serine protease